MNEHRCDRCHQQALACPLKIGGDVYWICSPCRTEFGRFMGWMPAKPELDAAQATRLAELADQWAAPGPDAA